MWCLSSTGRTLTAPGLPTAFTVAASFMRDLSDLSDDKDDGPFLVHCRHGADRTGVACAMFRIVEQGWSRVDAIREMKDGGFGFHPLWKNIPRYLEKVDVAKIRRGVDAAGK